MMESLASKLPSGIGYDWTGMSYQERLSGNQAPALYAISLIVVFLCLAALYESWSIPFSVMLVVPLGVIGIIYEARPNVTVDAAALCLKSGNAALLRGGKEAFRSNQAFVAVLRDALEEACLPRDCVALVADTSRESANELMGLTEYLDVLIPRGGAGLIRSVVENARVPVIQTGVGVCHI